MALESTAAGRTRRLTGIEGLRGIAAAAILVYHVWLYAAPSAQPVDLGGPLTKLCANLLAGVTLFFVLSGFLLYRPFVTALLHGTKLPSVRSYLRNRALRILPAYWFVLLAIVLAFHRSLLVRPGQLLANMAFLQDYVPGYMPVRNGGVGIVPALSLCIEVVFYVLLPVLVVAAARGRRLPPLVRASAAPALLVAVGIAGKIVSRLVPTGALWAAAFPVHADWFAAGMLVAIARVYWEDGRLRRPRPAVVRGAALAAVVLCAASVELYDKGVLGAIEYQTPIAAGFAVLLGVLVLGGEQTRLAGVLASRPLVAAGLGSYSLFLWHDPLLRALRGAGWTVAGSGGFVLDLLLVGVVSGILSMLTYLWVERPALARKTSAPPPDAAVRPVQPPPERVPAAAVGAVGELARD